MTLYQSQSQELGESTDKMVTKNGKKLKVKLDTKVRGCEAEPNLNDSEELPHLFSTVLISGILSAGGSCVSSSYTKSTSDGDKPPIPTRGEFVKKAIKKERRKRSSKGTCDGVRKSGDSVASLKGDGGKGDRDSLHQDGEGDRAKEKGKDKEMKMDDVIKSKAADDNKDVHKDMAASNEKDKINPKEEQKAKEDGANNTSRPADTGPSAANAQVADMKTSAQTTAVMTAPAPATVPESTLAPPASAPGPANVDSSAKAGTVEVGKQKLWRMNVDIDTRRVSCMGLREKRDSPPKKAKKRPSASRGQTITEQPKKCSRKSVG
jgi:hypothetical protein